MPSLLEEMGGVVDEVPEMFAGQLEAISAALQGLEAQGEVG